MSERDKDKSLEALRQWESDTGSKASMSEGNAFIDGYDAGCAAQAQKGPECAHSKMEWEKHMHNCFNCLKRGYDFQYRCRASLLDNWPRSAGVPLQPEAASAVSPEPQAGKEPQWISVEERCPNIEELPCLVWRGTTHRIEVGRPMPPIALGKSPQDRWMPLPDPPKSEPAMPQAQEENK